MARYKNAKNIQCHLVLCVLVLALIFHDITCAKLGGFKSRSKSRPRPSAPKQPTQSHPGSLSYPGYSSHGSSSSVHKASAPSSHNAPSSTNTGNQRPIGWSENVAGGNSHAGVNKQVGWNTQQGNQPRVPPPANVPGSNAARPPYPVQPGIPYGQPGVPHHGQPGVPHQGPPPYSHNQGPPPYQPHGQAVGYPKQGPPPPYGAPPGYGAHPPPYGAQSGFGGHPPPYGAQPGFGGHPPPYGAQPGFGGQHGYGGHPGFGGHSGYGGHPSYGGAPTFGGHSPYGGGYGGHSPFGGGFGGASPFGGGFGGYGGMMGNRKSSFLSGGTGLAVGGVGGLLAGMALWELTRNRNQYHVYNVHRESPTGTMVSPSEPVKPGNTYIVTPNNVACNVTEMKADTGTVFALSCNTADPFNATVVLPNNSTTVISCTAASGAGGGGLQANCDGTVKLNDTQLQPVEYELINATALWYEMCNNASIDYNIAWNETITRLNTTGEINANGTFQNGTYPIINVTIPLECYGYPPGYYPPPPPYGYPGYNSSWNGSDPYKQAPAGKNETTTN